VPACVAVRASASASMAIGNCLIIENESTDVAAVYTDISNAKN